VFVVAHHPEEHDGGEGERCGEADRAGRARGRRFFIDQREERRGYQSEQEASEHDGLEDEDDVPGSTTFRKMARTDDAVIVGEIEQDVAEAGMQA